MAEAACARCGFVDSDYSDDVSDLFGTLRSLAPIWRTMTDRVDAAALVGLEPIGAAINALDKQLPRLMKEGDPAELVPVLHDRIHDLRDAARVLHARGAGAPTQHGTVAQINASGGGVPKRPVVSAVIGRRALEGDRQAERRHHGRPLQALSLWSIEVIDALRAEGHTVYAGAAGENVTVAGIDWATIAPGVRMTIGDARVEISGFATPCVKNAQWFQDRDFRRIDHTLHPGWSRAYAWVLAEGAVTTGAAVVVEP